MLNNCENQAKPVDKNRKKINILNNMNIMNNINNVLNNLLIYCITVSELCPNLRE